MNPEIYPIGELPALGVVPRRMYAQVIREERFGPPASAFMIEEVDVPEIGDDECLVAVMAAGINYNGIWASAGAPVNVIRLHRKLGEGDFHIGGSDGSGIVYKVGRGVHDVAVGDEVIMHGGWWDRSCPHIRAGGDPMLSPTCKMWGYETSYGSFAQFTRVKRDQVIAKPPALTWEEGAAFLGNGAAAYRGMHGFAEHTVRPDDVVLVWGGAGGLGSLAIQVARAAGAIPIGVVSDAQKAEYCLAHGAKGVIDRTRFDHWGTMPRWDDTAAYARWNAGARAFGEAIWEAVGARRNPRIVFEHPGEATLPTSLYVCDTGGMVVICAGTTGYQVTFDLRYHWMRQKRFQGTHYANREQAVAMTELVGSGRVDPCLGWTFEFSAIGAAHQLMADRKAPHGNMVALVGAREPGGGRRA
jgi:crotonyl-CoA carboxylase/reductase